jgi:hypothetical protein
VSNILKLNSEIVAIEDNCAERLTELEQAGPVHQKAVAAAGT